ncbi:MAG TPA: RluA family pseudouridine synthase [Limnochordia bacterium]|nr:RluA family pseudouridine synthase [Limnochordia bacterium]
MEKKKTLAKVTIPPELAGWTVAAVLKDELRLSARQRQKVVRTRGIRLDGKPVHSLVKVKVGQVLEVLLPEAEQVKVPARPLSLDVIYEDEYLMVVNKPAGVAVHNVRPGGYVSLVEGAAYYFQQHGRTITPRPVHRLDKDASGVVIFAKSAQVQDQLTKTWPEAEKIYWVQVHGRITDRGVITSPVKGKPAATEYTPLETGEDVTTLQVRLHTGRTHQIRIHLSQIGHPVVGDPLYGYGENQPLALHCRQITIIHPAFNQPIQFAAPLP